MMATARGLRTPEETMARKRKPAKSKLAKNLHEFRIDHDLTQEEAAAAIGVDRRTWLRWESEEIEPSPPLLKLIQQLLAHPEEFIKKN
jgi:DNA-binding XRE family transcriptional regulator